MDKIDQLFQEENYIRDGESLENVISYINFEDNQTISFNIETKSIEIIKDTGEIINNNNLYGIVNLSLNIILIIYKMIEELGWKNQK